MAVVFISACASCILVYSAIVNSYNGIRPCFLYGLISRLEAYISSDNKGEVVLPNSQEEQNIDNTTLVLISAAVAAYTHNKARVRRVRVLPSKAKQGVALVCWHRM